MKIAGLLSGTSLDGIDVAVCEVGERGGAIVARVERFATVPWDDALRADLLAAMPPAAVGTLRVAELHGRVGAAFGAALRTVAADVPLDAVASHGVTIAHDDRARRTLQIGDLFRIRESAGVTVIGDFRSGDTAAGGTGAPLVPFVDALLFGTYAPCVALNLGGIANLTVLPEGIAFDSGPANLPLDGYLALRTNGAARFDRDGRFARAGRPSLDLLAELLDDPYFRRPAPKSAGREEYGTPYVARWRARLDALSLEDATATLTELVARSVADAIRTSAPHASMVIASGGGTRNPALVGALGAALPGIEVRVSDALGIDADAKEALAFAVLGYAALRGIPAGLPRVTGARGARVLGAIAPVDLRGLLERAEREAKSTA